MKPTIKGKTKTSSNGSNKMKTTGRKANGRAKARRRMR